MVGSSAGQFVGRTASTTPSVEIVNWPLRDDGVAAGFMILLFVGTAVVTGSLARSPGMGCVVFAALAAAGWRLWIPVRFELGAKGVVQTVLGRRRRIPWSEFARYEVRGKGVLLLADAEPSPLAPLRGLFVRWREQREELLEVVDFFLNSASRSGEPARKPSED